jgi:hypothetical protein
MPVATVISIAVSADLIELKLPFAQTCALSREWLIGALFPPSIDRHQQTGWAITRP